MTKEEILKKLESYSEEHLLERFPELKESKDEKIRKEIIKHFSRVLSGEDVEFPPQDDLEKWIAYLEKLKDADKAILAVDKIDRYIDGHVTNAHDMKDSHPEKKYCQGIDDALSDISGILLDVYSEKQKEQKDYRKLYEDIAKSEWFKKAYEGKSLGCDYEEKEQNNGMWSEDDEKKVEAMCKEGELKPSEREWLKNLKYRLKKEQKLVDPSDDELQGHQDELHNFKVFASKQAKEHHIFFVHDFEWHNFCAGILFYFNEQQKPAEWSEEDEKMRNAILQDLANIKAVYPKINIQDEFDWFKSLPERFNLSPKQEWSEEDEENFKWFDKFFRAESIVLGGRDIPQDKYLWFKSFRSRPKPSDTWKPSEEQMEVLLNAEGLVRANNYPENAKILATLYEQLKKLM